MLKEVMLGKVCSHFASRGIQNVLLGINVPISLSKRAGAQESAPYALQNMCFLILIFLHERDVGGKERE